MPHSLTFNAPSPTLISGEPDLKAEAWCESCEKEFAHLDTAGASFFRSLDSKKVSLNQTNLHSFKYVFHDQDNYYFVSKFISSVIVRYFLHRLSKGESVEDEGMLNEVFRGYKGNLEPQIILYDLSKFLLTSTKLPRVVKNGVQLMINGYLINLKMPYSKVETADLFESGEILVFNVTDPNTPYVKSFFKALALKLSGF